MTFLARFQRAHRADPRQGEIERLHARLARCEEARAAAEEARAEAVEQRDKWKLWCKDRAIALHDARRIIAELEAELAPYKGHVG